MESLQATSVLQDVRKFNRCKELLSMNEEIKQARKVHPEVLLA